MDVLQVKVTDLTMGSECIGELAYEPTAPAIAMGSMFVIWLIDFFGSRRVRLSNMLWIPLLIYR